MEDERPTEPAEPLALDPEPVIDAPIERAPEKLVARADEDLEKQLAEEAPASKRETSVHPPRRRWVRWLVAILAVLLLLIGAAAAIVAIYWDDIVRAAILSEAQAHGYSLSFEAFDLTKTSLVLTNVSASSSALPGVEVKTARMTIALGDGYAPKSVAMTDVTASLDATPNVAVSAATTTADLTDFKPSNVKIDDARVHATRAADLVALLSAATTGPLATLAPTIGKATVTIDSLASALPEPLTLACDSLKTRADGVDLTGVETTIPIVKIPVHLAAVGLTRANGWLALTIPGVDYLSLSVDEAVTKALVSVTAIPADFLAKQFGWSRPPGFSLSASTTVALPADAGAAITGTFTAALAHYIPPHPVELDGIVFGDATNATGNFSLTATTATLTDLKAVAGALTLSGKGVGTLDGGGQLKLDLGGSIACSALAVSAVGAHLGLPAAFITSQITSRHLTGTVEVQVGVVVRGSDAAHPEIHPSAILHCGIAL